MGTFVGALDVTPLPDAVRWKLHSDFIYTANSGSRIVIPAGFVTDFASIPPLNKLGFALILLGRGISNISRVCWLGYLLVLLGLFAVWVADELRPWGEYGYAAILHDYLYNNLLYNRRRCDYLLLEGMKACGTPKWKMFAIFTFVRLFGWIPWWRKSARRRSNPYRAT